MPSPFQVKPASRASLLILALQFVAVFNAHEVDAQTNVVRLAVVNTPAESGLLTDILPHFEKQTELQVDLYAAADAILPVRNGPGDLTIPHFEHTDVELLVTDCLCA